MDILKALLIAAVSYVLGSVSLSIFMSKRLFGGDVRAHGSGNAGATTMAAVYGRVAVVLTLAADVVKAAVAATAAWAGGGDRPCSLGMLGQDLPLHQHLRGRDSHQGWFQAPT